MNIFLSFNPWQSYCFCFTRADKSISLYALFFLSLNFALVYVISSFTINDFVQQVWMEILTCILYSRGL